MTATKKWFKAKSYGYGWVPQTFEGWLTTLIYSVLVIGLSIIFVQRLNDPLFDQWVSVGIYLSLIVTFTIALITIAYKTGEKPHWHWGRKQK